MLLAERKQKKNENFDTEVWLDQMQSLVTLLLKCQVCTLWSVFLVSKLSQSIRKWFEILY